MSGYFRGFFRNEYQTTVTRNVHVLLVDHDPDCLISTAKMLERCGYKVTYFELATTAIAILLGGKSHFDIVMANANSPDMHAYNLLEQAVNMNTPVILMSDDDNVFLATGALEQGALLYVKKPVTMDMLKCLWQHVVREKMTIQKEKAKKMPIKDKEAHGPKHQINNNNARKRECMEWTQELHEKFMAAVEKLGDGRCFPKDIMEEMNTPGLTRMQVASHLQKCRNSKWRSPGERKPQQDSVVDAAPAEETSGRNQGRKFGLMPRVILRRSLGININQSIQEYEQDYPDQLNSRRPSMDLGSQWSSETSSFPTDSSETGGGAS